MGDTGVQTHTRTLHDGLQAAGIECGVVTPFAALSRQVAGVRKRTMAQAVEQLERMGYVERRPNPRDRRSRLVLLTERGESVKPVTHATAERVEKRWAQLTSPEELEAVRGSLLHLLNELRAQ